MANNNNDNNNKYSKYNKYNNNNGRPAPLDYRKIIIRPQFPVSKKIKNRSPVSSIN